MGSQTGLHQGVAMTTSTNPARESLRQEQQEQRKAASEAARKGPDAELDTALKATFPASDPVAAQTPTKSGAADGKAS